MVERLAFSKANRFEEFRCLPVEPKLRDRCLVGDPIDLVPLHGRSVEGIIGSSVPRLFETNPNSDINQMPREADDIIHHSLCRVIQKASMNYASPVFVQSLVPR